MTRRRHDDTHYPGWCKDSGPKPPHRIMDDLEVALAQAQLRAENARARAEARRQGVKPRSDPDDRSEGK